MSTKVQRVPLNYPSLAEKTRENVENIKNPVHGGHLADDVCSTQHNPVTGAEWAESASERTPDNQTLGAPDVVGAVESHIDDPAHLHLCESCDEVLAEVFEACHDGNAYDGLCSACVDELESD